MPSTILSDNGVTSNTSGIKVAGSNDGILELQTTTAGGTATTAMTINTTQQVAFTAGTAAAPSITPSGDPNTGIFFPAADTIAFAEGGVEAMRIDSSGNLLVGSTSTAGTTNPTAIITVAGRLRSTNGQTASIANGATADISLTMPRVLVAYIFQSNVNSAHMSAGFFRSNDNGASSTFTLFGQSQDSISVTSPSAGTIRVTNSTGGSAAFNYTFTIIAGL